MLYPIYLKIEKLNSICREDVIYIEKYHPGLITDHLHLNSFTATSTEVNVVIVLEILRDELNIGKPIELNIDDVRSRIEDITSMSRLVLDPKKVKGSTCIRDVCIETDIGNSDLSEIIDILASEYNLFKRLKMDGVKFLPKLIDDSTTTLNELFILVNNNYFKDMLLSGVENTMVGQCTIIPKNREGYHLLHLFKDNTFVDALEIMKKEFT